MIKKLLFVVGALAVQPFVYDVTVMANNLQLGCGNGTTQFSKCSLTQCEYCGPNAKCYVENDSIVYLSNCGEKYAGE